MSYAENVPAYLDAKVPAPFRYESTGVETYFRDARDPAPLATGAGKTFTACAFICRLIKYAKAKRVLFLVDDAYLNEALAA